MQTDLEPERGVYERDKALAHFCAEMTYRGIHVDVARKAELTRILKNRRNALKGMMRHEVGEKDFSPARLGEVRRVLFGKLRGKYVRVTSAGLPSTNNETLEMLRGDDTRLARFADALLRWRLVGKVKGTYLDAVVVHGDNRTRYSWKAFGTVSGRLSGRLQSCPRWASDPVESRVREIYTASPGNVLVYFDVSQAEMRLAAYLAADPVFMKAADSSDVHAANAKAVFPEIAAKGWLDGDAKKDPLRGKPYRDISKNLGFAIAYGTEAAGIFIFLRSKGFAVTMQQVELILAKLRSAYHVYYRFVEKNVEAVRQCGYMRTALWRRIRWFGWFPKPTEIANFPVQSALADIMNERCIELQKRIAGTGAWPIAQIHDALIVDCPPKEATRIESLIKELWAQPVPLAGGALTLPIDLKRGERWSELG